MKPNVYGFIPEENLIDLNYTCRLVVDPDPNYFVGHAKNDRSQFEKMILIHGCEPKSINNITNQIIEYKDSFDKIYTFDEEVLSQCDNSELFCFGSCWVLSNKVGENIMTEDQFIEKTYNKNFKVSFIKSFKNQLEGHKLRHLVPNILNNKSFTPLMLENIPIKYPLFVNSMFHITIENCKENNYFTEKLVDCFITKTIPIYWGCPNIDNYFDPSGIIKFSTIEELNDILTNLTVDDYYSRLDVIEKNYITSKKYAFFFERVNNIFKNL